jgi:hypothetical protein
MIARCLGIGLLTAAAWLGAQAQQSLAELVSEAKADWMLGRWEAQTDNGATITLNFSWDLDKKVVVLHGKLPDMEFKGYSALEPGAMQVNYTGFDNRGVVTKGSWGLENDELVLRAESRSAERTWKMGVVFTGKDGQELVLRLHGVGDSGELVSPARTTLKFKKQK